MNAQAITPEQLSALREFAARHQGQDWKTKLSRAWMLGNTQGELEELYPLRNSHGPQWLAGFSFPEDEDQSGVQVEFQKQGGKVALGEAVGRMGKAKFLIRYKIEDGSPRERWIPKSRLFEPRMDALLELEEWVTKSCPAVKFDPPVVMRASPWSDEVNGEVLGDRACPECGGRHKIRQTSEPVEAKEGDHRAYRVKTDGGPGWRVTEYTVTGLASLKLGVERKG